MHSSSDTHFFTLRKEIGIKRSLTSTQFGLSTEFANLLIYVRKLQAKKNCRRAYSRTCAGFPSLNETQHALVKSNVTRINLYEYISYLVQSSSVYVRDME